MEFKKSIGIALAAVTLTAAPLAANAQQASSNWQGFYAGLNAGGLWAQPSASVNYSNSSGGFAGSSGSFMGGAQVGYNWMFGNIVVGPEIDFQGSTLQTGVSGNVGPSNISANYGMPWFSTFRGRVGYAYGSVMPYVTGGAVWGSQRLSGTDSANGYFDVSNNFWTYTFGGGVEGKINEAWSAKLEYLWIGTPDTVLSTPASTSVSERSIGNVVRVGVNYHFN